MRSIVLLTPNGLPQRMQGNGSSSLSTASCSGVESQTRDERDDLLRTGRLAQPALHAGILGEAQHGPVGIVRQRAGRAGRDARRGTACSRNVDLDRAERRSGGQRNGVGRGRGRAVEFAQRRGAARRACRRPAKNSPAATPRCAGSIARSASPRANGSSVSISRERLPESRDRRGSCSASAMVWQARLDRGAACRAGSSARPPLP